MLNLKEIAERISDPAVSRGQDTEDLKKLCETYPYSQIFPILYLNVLSKSNDVRFDEELQRYAYRISDRTMLYNLLHQNSSDGELIKGAEIVEPRIEVEEPIDKSSTAPAALEIDEKTSKSIVESDDLTSKIEVNIESSEFSEAKEGTDEPAIEAPNFEIETKEAAIEPVEVSSEKEIIEPAFEVKEEIPEIVEESPEVHFELDLSDSSDEKIVENPVLEHKYEDENIVVSGFESIPIDEVFQKLEDEQEVRDQRFANELTAQTIASAYSIEEEEKRLGRLKTENQEKEQKIEDDLISSKHQENKASTQSDFERKKSFSSWLHANKNYSEHKDEKVSVDDLISKFIEESPKISPANEKLFEGRTENNEFYSPIKKAKESLDEQNLPVSETLAKVFAAQGNFPKAIYAYEQLMLIIPEKKIFFAVQIKELQKKLNK